MVAISAAYTADTERSTAGNSNEDMTDIDLTLRVFIFSFRVNDVVIGKEIRRNEPTSANKAIAA